jgi:hypothetical protein
MHDIRRDLSTLTWRQLAELRTDPHLHCARDTLEAFHETRMSMDAPTLDPWAASRWGTKAESIAIPCLAGCFQDLDGLGRVWGDQDHTRLNYLLSHIGLPARIDDPSRTREQQQSPARPGQRGRAWQDVGDVCHPLGGYRSALRLDRSTSKAGVLPG